jgi:hypothetical protein
MNHLLLCSLLSVLPQSEPALEPTWFGAAVDGAGDVNLDGYGDLIVGAWWVAGKQGQGRVLVFSGHDGRLLYTFEGAEKGELFGLSVAGAGDVDADGAGDFLIGAPLAAASGKRSGTVRLFTGRTGKQVHQVEGEKKAGLFGVTIASAGDTNQDGFDDFVVGAPGGALDGSGDELGHVFLFNGKSGKGLEEWQGEEEGDGFGWSVDGAGDVNGDGSDDVVIGAWRAEYVQVVSGQGGKLLQEYRAEPGGGRYAFSVAGAGDVDQDAMADLIVGIPRGEEIGALVLSVHKEKDLYGLPRDLTPGREGWSFGISVDGAGDVNGDGFADLIVGDPGFPRDLRDTGGTLGSFLAKIRAPAARPGRAYILSGQRGELLHTLEGSAPDDWFGVRVRGAGDVNQDGRGDVIVAAGRGSGVLARVFAGNDGKLLYELKMP